jgi:hypothetical protein
VNRLDTPKGLTFYGQIKVIKSILDRMDGNMIPDGCGFDLHALKVSTQNLIKDLEKE